MSDDREESPLFGRLSWPEAQPGAEPGAEPGGQPAPEPANPKEERAGLEKERARVERAQARQDGTPVGLLTTRRVVAGVWLAVCGIQVVIWALVCIIGGEFAFPWWLYTVGGGGVIVGVLWLVTNSVVRKRGSAR